MNIQRLEMVKLMLERMIAGSWHGVEELPKTEVRSWNITGKSPTLPIQVLDFDLSSWRSNVRVDETNVCGYSACVVGHMCFDEEFRKLGWNWDYAAPRFDGLTDWGGVNKFFGFDEDRDYGIGELLFIEDAYSVKDEDGEFIRMSGDDRRHVINRIDELIQLGESKFLRKHKKLLEFIQ